MDGKHKNGEKKIVLAYSGGLDTSVILVWLLEKGYEVIAYIADVGQTDDLAAAERKAFAAGASKVYVEDLKEELVTDFVFPMISANAIYEGRYLQGTAVARPLIAKRQIEIAHLEGAAWVSHGATGKGNDQVRFELAYYALDPEIQVFAPWKDPEFLADFRGRTDMINYAESKGIEITSTKAKPFSEDENLLHISHEAGILEDPNQAAPAEVYSRTVAPELAPDESVSLRIAFKDGVPIEVSNLTDGTRVSGPLPLFTYLNEVGSAHAVGRIDMVENRFVGVKSRGVYETPGGTILMAALRDLEGVAMDREVMRLRNMLADKIAQLIYNGFWFSPEMDFLMSAVNKSQELIDGHVDVKLYKGGVYPLARFSPSSLYDQELSSMDVEGGFDQTDAQGFIRIHAIRLKAHHAICKKQEEAQQKKQEQAQAVPV
ncbi:MAG: argininosuccinate synthase [Candidatus Eisenbacteria bacterium]|uniref:Argininosuccinate synthase n=1 Tax=Eiseniibacteriota bacterium TaxID=2212470 RepID=A0A7Y2E9T4_UNCEI|nr:argininosuccinate synthase [Candidatus Eisenbacteria bacterium]